MKPKVAICIPSGSHWHAEMALSMISIVRETPLDLLVFNLMGSQISLQRNELVRRSLDAGATHLYWQDSDMIVPGSVIMEFLDHHKDIVGATYLKRVMPFSMLGKIEQGVGRLKPAKRMPGGCMLVRVEVYEKMRWPWYYEQMIPGKLTWEIGVTQGEDYCFSEKAIANGFDLWCDIQMSQRITHIGTQNIVMQLKEGHPDRWEQPHES